MNESSPRYRSKRRDSPRIIAPIINVETNTTAEIGIFSYSYKDVSFSDTFEKGKSHNRESLSAKYAKESLSIVETIDDLYSITSKYLWVIYNWPDGRPSPVQDVLFPCFHKTLIGLYTSHDLTSPDNKFEAFNLPTFAASQIEAPLLEGCVAWLECKIISEPHIQNTYDLFLGEVVAAWADDRVFSDGRWHFEGNDDLRTIHHVAGGAFMSIGEAFKIGA